MKEMQNPNSPSAPVVDRRTPRHRQGSESLDRLLDGAQATFAERGYHLASVHEICTQASVGIGTFYAHFDHKKQLLERLMTERALTLPQLLVVADLADVASLTAALERAFDDPIAIGLWRAWHEGVSEDPDLANAHKKRRGASQAELAALIVDARRGRPRKAPSLDASVVAWTMLMFAREFTIHGCEGAPGVETVARIIHDLVYGP